MLTEYKTAITHKKAKNLLEMTEKWFKRTNLPENPRLRTLLRAAKSKKAYPKLSIQICTDKSTAVEKLEMAHKSREVKKSNSTAMYFSAN